MAEFFAMGGYAVYVWPCFGVGIGLMVALAIYSKVELQRNERLFKAMQEAQTPIERSHRREKGGGHHEAQAQEA